MKYIIGVVVGFIILFLYCSLKLASETDHETYKDK